MPVKGWSLVLFRAFWRRSGYYVYLKDAAGEINTSLTFDTGAVCTVLSVEALTADPVDKAALCEKLDQRLACRRFLSASGTEMHGYLVCAEGMKLSDYPIDKFYYYLIVDVDDVLALLGDDLLSCCEFSHRKKTDIEVSGFDEPLYQSAYGGALDGNVLQALIAEVTVSDV